MADTLIEHFNKMHDDEKADNAWMQQFLKMNESADGDDNWIEFLEEFRKECGKASTKADDMNVSRQYFFMWVHLKAALLILNKLDKLEEEVFRRA